MIDGWRDHEEVLRCAPESEVAMESCAVLGVGFEPVAIGDEV